MKYILFYLLMFIGISCKNNDNTGSSKTGRENLNKLNWIEGNWQGLYQGKPFYEIYKIQNDSTLEITSYEWDGKDSTSTSRSYVKWTNRNYFLGDSLNYKVTSITDTSIYMEPNYHAFNSILWKKKDKDHWDAVLTTNKGEIIYNMERIDHFPK